jgi:hypothetical protein
MLQSGAKNSIRGWDDALVSGAGNDVMTGGFGICSIPSTSRRWRCQPRFHFESAGLVCGDTINLSAHDPTLGWVAIRSLRSSARPRSQPPVNCESCRGDDTVIQANTNANRSTLEFELHLLGPRPLTAGDFVV